MGDKDKQPIHQGIHSMKDIETIRLYQELLMWCDKADWKVETKDLHDRFALVPNNGPRAALYSNSLYECIGFVAGYMAGKSERNS